MYNFYILYIYILKLNLILNLKTYNTFISYVMVIYKIYLIIYNNTAYIT